MRLKFLGAAAAVLALFFILDFPRATVLCQRFLQPDADITLTRLQAKSGDLTIGKGENVTLEFTATGKATRSAQLSLHPASGRDEVLVLDKDAKESTAGVSKFVYTANSVTESFSYSARSGDGRTAAHRVTVLERPSLAGVQFRIEAPAYSRLPVVNEKSLPRQTRALEGSKLEISFLPDQELSGLDLKFSDGKIQPLQKGPDHQYHFNLVLSNTIAFEPVLTNVRHLDNQSRPDCEIIVYQDQPPTVNITSPGDQITARPDDKIQIEFEARDDFGLTRAELVVTVQNPDGTASPPVTIPIPLDPKEIGSKLIKKEVDLDLAQFNLKQDQELNYSVRVTDTKNDSSFSTSSPDAASRQTQLAETPSAPNQSQPDTASNQRTEGTERTQGANQSQPNTASSQSQPNTESDQSAIRGSTELAEVNPQSAITQAKSPDSQNQTSPPQANQNHIAMASPNSNSSSNSTPSSPSSQPPPNSMTKRVLDVAQGQTSSAQPMHIIVDQFARSFDGQMREKQEMAIDPVLKQLEELLRRAYELTEINLLAAQSKEGLGLEQTWALEESKEQVRQAGRAVDNLKKASAGTAYAFIGLQVSDIGDTHIAPAREELGEVTLQSASAKEDRDHLTQASFHLQQARKMLADLTKTYDSVKQDNKLADAMQQLKKMHQIFLEDTQAMLASKKPPINSVERKVAEVDNDYVAKLNALLEEQKKIMAELAKILADDPRMLRRFMALQELDGTTLRDQMTLLAQRQQTLAKQTAEWMVAGDDARPALAGHYLTAQAVEQSEIASQAAKLHENMITWLPDGVEQDKEPMATPLTLASEGARLAALAADQASPDAITNSLLSARKALDQFRLLHDYLPDMSSGADTQNLAVFTANRLNETADLVTQQSGWIKKMESLRGGDFSQAVEVDQHRLALDTTTLSEKLDAAVPSLAALSSEIQDKSGQLLHTVEKQVLPEETRAVDALARNTLKDAVSRQQGATTAFAQAETQFDELLRLLAAKLDSAPAPTDPGRNRTLEEMLAMLKDEKKAAETLGLPNRPINVQVMRDWLNPGSGSQQAGGQGGPQSRSAQARSAQQQARDSSRRANRASDQADRDARLRAAQLTGQDALPGSSNLGGPKAPSNGWNTLASKLGDELRQSRDNIPPEQYRQAIEQYFNSISETVPATPADSRERNP